MSESFTEINCLGLKCPLPALRMERALRDGLAQFMLITDDPVSVIDIPFAAEKMQAKAQSLGEASGVYKFSISKNET